MSYAAPSIHYNFDSNLTNHGTGGNTYDATIVNGSLDYDTTNKQIGSASTIVLKLVIWISLQLILL